MTLITPLLVAVLDASVLYPASLRDILMRLASERLYQPKWTDRIHDEWTRNLKKNRPDLSETQISRTRELMNKFGGDWQTPPFEHLIPTLSLPDADDRHVLAAAIASKASYLVTLNLRHFPAPTLVTYGVTPLSPDAFLIHLFDASPQMFIQAIRWHRASLQNPPRTAEQHLTALCHTGFVQTVSKLATYANAI